jgi:hypothetical protein
LNVVDCDFDIIVVVVVFVDVVIKDVCVPIIVVEDAIYNNFNQNKQKKSLFFHHQYHCSVPNINSKSISIQ